MNELIDKFCDITFVGDSSRWPFLNGAWVEAVDMPMIKLRGRQWGELPDAVWVNVSQILKINAAVWQPERKAAA